MDEQSLLERALQIRRNLEDSGGYWAHEPDSAMRVGAEPYVIRKSDADIAEWLGVTVYAFWTEAEQVYQQAVKRFLPEWVRKSLEGPISKECRLWQTILTASPSLPALARMDLSSFWHPVEIQERIGFLGGSACWHDANELCGYPEGTRPLGRYDFAKGVARAFVGAAGKGYPTVVLVTPKGYRDEHGYLSQRLCSFGFTVIVKDRQELLRGEGVTRSRLGRLVVDGCEVDLVYRRVTNLEDLAGTPGGQDVLYSCLEGLVTIEPPLNLLYDAKVSFAWVNHPALSDLFSEAVKTLIPPTALVPASVDEEFVLEGEEVNLRSILDLSNNKRRYVVKYAGPSTWYGTGGRAVYNLEDTSKVAEKAVSTAVESVRQGHPWIIQPKDDARFPATYLAGDELVTEPNMHARFCLFYQQIDGLVHLFAAHGNFRKGWKVGGGKDTVFRTICVS